MVVHRKKKVRKYRGSTTHGGGSRKKRRGSGSRGGVGRAGSGKRASHKKRHFSIGTSGFLPRRDVLQIKAKECALNLEDLTPQKIDALVAQGSAQKNGDTVFIDLTSLGYTKLLGSGKCFGKFHLLISSWSSSAEEKVKAAGGEVREGKERGKE